MFSRVDGDRVIYHCSGPGSVGGLASGDPRKRGEIGRGPEVGEGEFFVNLFRFIL